MEVMPIRVIKCRPDERNGYIMFERFRKHLEVIYQTRGRAFPPISKHREVGWKNEAQPSFF